MTTKAVQQGNLWGWRAADWATFMEPGLAPLYEAVLDAGQVREGTSLLDAGCGTGGAALAALGRGARVAGFDAAEGFVSYARTRLPEEVDLRLGDLEAIPFGDREFDCVMAVNALQFTADRAQAARELARVVRQRVVVAVWTRPEECEMRLISQAIIAALPQKPSGRGMLELSETGEVENLLEGAGLQPQAAVEVRLRQTMPDEDSAVRALMSTGPNHRASQILGEQRVEECVRKVLRDKFLQADGSVAMTNYFRCVPALRH